MSDSSPECARDHVDDGGWVEAPGPGWRVIFVEDGHHMIDLPQSTQAVVLFPGDMMAPTVLLDSYPPDTLTQFTGPRAAVVVARLRYWAQAIEDAGQRVPPAVP